MKDPEEKSKFDPVNKELEQNVTDISASIKRKRNEDAPKNESGQVENTSSSQNKTSENANVNSNADANAIKSAETLKYDNNQMGSRTFKRMDDD